MKVLLINPNFRGSRNTFDVNVRLRQPLDLAYLSSILEKKGIYNEILDANVLGLSEKKVLEEIKKFDPSYIILTTSPLDRWECPQTDISMVFSLIRKIDSSSKVIVYGTHGSVDPQWVWEKSGKRIDYVIKGEPEKPVSELFDLILSNRRGIVGGVLQKDGNSLVGSRDYNIYANIDEIPMPNFKKLDMALYEYNGDDLPKPFSILLSSRGCPFRCTFCLRTMFKNYRTHSPERVVAEIDYLKKHYSMNSIFFQDWEFLIDKERAEKIYQLMRENNIYVNFGINARANDLRLDLVQKLQEVGLKRINIGLESASNEILRVIKKGITRDDLVRAVELSQKTGVKIGYYGLYNLPHDNLETIKETAKFIAENNIDDFRADVVRPYPGTELASGKGITWENVDSKAGRVDTKIHPLVTKWLYKFFINYYRGGIAFVIKKVPKIFQRVLRHNKK